MPSEQWTHLTLSYDEESIKLYKDGALIEEQAATQGINNFADELFHREVHLLRRVHPPFLLQRKTG